eukprot:Skav206867  [mRNA]  locus=scaffold898:90580:90907:- [translate_table: standard]
MCTDTGEVSTCAPLDTVDCGHFCCFGSRAGLLSKWLDGPGRAALVGRILHRAGTFGGHFSSRSSIKSMSPLDKV